MALKLASLKLMGLKLSLNVLGRLLHLVYLLDNRLQLLEWWLQGKYAKEFAHQKAVEKYKHNQEPNLKTLEETLAEVAERERQAETKLPG